MSINKQAFIPGTSQPPIYPLGRYLPVIPNGMITRMLDKKTKRGGVLVDPFGTSPAAIIEAARAGYRIIVACNNPIISHMLRVKAKAYSNERFLRILSTLSATRKGDERLERHLEDLYQVQCPECSASNQARMFIWAKGASTPTAAVLECPACKRKSELPAGPESQQKLFALLKGSMYRARALERIAAVNDPIRPRVEQALESYQARPLYVLITILNRLESLQLDVDDESILQALLISAFDAGNTLWPHPSSNLRPKQLVLPPNIRENNLWLVLNEAISEWCGDDASVPVVDFPQIPPMSGGISIFPGRIRELARDIGTKIKVDGLLAVMPRPNQAFWTLSAVWAGWLWGPSAVQPFKSALVRQRYDWQWYADALASITASLKVEALKDTVVTGLITEYEPTFLNSTLTAFDSGGFSVTGYSYNPEVNIVQLTWEHNDGISSPTVDTRTIIHEAINEQMVVFNQPVEYSIVGAAVGLALANNHLYRVQPGEASDRYTATQNSLKAELLTAGDYIRFRGQRALESEIWWKNGLKVGPYSLDDQIELAMLEILMKASEIKYTDLQDLLFNQFSGLLTPSSELIRTILDSYGEMTDSTAGVWRLLHRENPLTRQADISDILKTLKKIGKQFGYITDGETDVVWKDDEGNLVNYYVPSVHACISGLMINSTYPSEKSVIAIPASRANLLLYKVEKNPLLYEKISAGWRIVKFRHIRQISSENQDDAEQWQLQLDMDPLEYKPTQMKMF